MHNRPASVFATGLLALGLLASGCSATTATPPSSLDPTSPTLTASGIAFDETALTVPANRPFTLIFVNRDDAAHNVAIQGDAAGGGRLFDGEVVHGPATRWYAVPPLRQGSYVFVCVLHSNMTGRLIAS